MAWWRKISYNTVNSCGIDCVWMLSIIVWCLGSDLVVPHKEAPSSAQQGVMIISFPLGECRLRAYEGWWGGGAIHQNSFQVSRKRVSRALMDLSTPPWLKGRERVTCEWSDDSSWALWLPTTLNNPLNTLSTVFKGAISVVVVPVKTI